MDMYCAQCGYDLHGCDAACPECGGGFNPRDPSTFRTRRPLQRVRVWPYLAVVAMVLVTACVLLSFPFVFMGICIALFGSGGSAAIGPGGALGIGFLLDLFVVGPVTILLLLRVSNRILPLDQPEPDDDE